MTSCNAKKPHDFLYEEAYRQFVFGQRTIETISEKTGLDVALIEARADKEKWNADRRSWLSVERGISKDLVEALKALGEKAKEGDVRAVAGLLNAQKELRRSQDPRTVLAEFSSALVTMLENEGHPETAVIVAGYLEAAADKVID